MDKEKWNKLVLENSGGFLQSFEWGEFQQALDRRVERIVTEDFAAQAIFYSLPFGLNYGYIPRGPVTIRGSIRDDLFWKEFEKIRDSQTVFFEFDLLDKVNFLTPRSKSRQPRLTSVLDLTPSAKEIFSNFHKNHRYSVHQAEKQGVEIRQEKGWEGFFAILERTAKAQKFRVWPRSYYQIMSKTLEAAGAIEIWSAYQKKDLVVSHLYTLFGGRVTHLFGGSDPARRGLMAPHALHWQAIREFKKRGFYEYDFWGIDDKNWPGLTRFKERFGGRRVEYPGSYVRVLRPLWHRAYRLGRGIKR